MAQSGSPSWSETILSAIDGKLATLNTVSLGWIQALNSDGTAIIRRAFGAYYHGDNGEQPVKAEDLPAVPLLMPGLGNGWTLETQPQPGDRVLLLTVQREIDPWLEGASAQFWPAKGRRFNVNDTVALLWHQTTAGTSSLVISGHGAKVELKPDGTVELNSGTLGAARVNDPVQVSLTPATIQALAASLLLTGAFTPSGSLPVPPPAAIAASGVITAGSGTVKIGG